MVPQAKAAYWVAAPQDTGIVPRGTIKKRTEYHFGIFSPFLIIYWVLGWCKLGVCFLR